MSETSKEIANWADPAMFAAEPIEDEGPRVHIINATPDPLGTIAATCCMYEGKVIRSRSRVTDEMRRYYWEQVKKTHLKAPLEFVDFHFMIEGVTRAFTHQIVRQRTAVYAQESMRFAVKENMVEEIDLPLTIHKGSLEEGVWTGAIESIESAYKYLIANGVPAEDARGLLPHATRTRLHYKTNLRNLIDHAGNRLCTQAQFEWRFVLSRLVAAVRDHYTLSPASSVGDAWQFQHIADDNTFKPVCFQLGHCPFTSDMDRKCTIRSRVQHGQFDEIQPEEWLLDYKAAR